MIKRREVFWEEGKRYNEKGGERIENLEFLK